MEQVVKASQAASVFCEYVRMYNVYSLTGFSTRTNDIVFPLMQKLECVKQARKSIAKGCEIKQVNKHKKATLTSHARQALDQTHVLSCNWSKHALTAIQTTRFDGSGPA